LCCETVRVFVSILGAESGNLALKVMATGGVYLAGGIPPRILSFLTDGAFMEAFCNKGRMSDLLERIPVHVVLNPKTALIGAAAYGFDLLGA
jgi:glucokinase